MDQLTTIAALPGSGAGCVSALQAERNDRPLIEPGQALALMLGYVPPGALVFPPIDLGPIGGDGSWPALEGGYGC